ncbi:hypothetical protein BDW74DRAFT_70572 [Aspergillus multicolor]|uniref:uncharacterized protein n=1 Tax=Aspergillus multicolor TaxID=41759 RepID=UPI003CCDDC9A
MRPWLTRSNPFIYTLSMPLQGIFTRLPSLPSSAGACSLPNIGARSVWQRPRRTPHARSCLSMIKDRTIHWKLFNLVLSTVLLLINLAIYIAFVVIRAIQGPWLYIVLTLILLTIGVIWCHALCRFVVAVYQFPNYTANLALPIEMTDTAGYAHPNQPIHVTMTTDEEHSAVSHAHDAPGKVTVPPPAYGVWRNSVRLDPNPLHWQRVDIQPAMPQTDERREETSNRKIHGHPPPSHMSGDGVEYVVEALPRSLTKYLRR